ncbi:class I SAM-dependent DNA methyltransferase [Gymnodinialimonas ceratoperidinii]|uniref:Methyltransferase domain-containing protein n=1 Tax=Gymnodinialimonas ceratoperidinii TaxID=2856823 RepID=A0A8F6TV89_9RHOB|nr:methyltransferase domain-containing protein [Gymnodinialimonas ceratoperidinii]QXT38508.1 methyltransferase domain-containing protein [Gymnodinialimonas ceratoperidinii]
MADKPFLSKVYDLKGDGVRDYYDKWAETYEDELTENAYATPARCAAALAATDLPKDTPILDFACGTGLSGAALHAEGFTIIDGIDLSEAMLAKARAKKIYRNLTRASADAPPPVEPNAYRAITAIGAIGPGAAPAEVIAPLIQALPTGGYFVISLNDVALDTPAFPAALDAQADSIEKVSEERGPHLPGIDVMSTVYVFRRT